LLRVIFLVAGPRTGVFNLCSKKNPAQTAAARANPRNTRGG
jgi:hypothetical protein